MTNTTPAEDPIIEWRAPQHAHHHRGHLWYICAIGTVTALLVYSIFTQAWTFTVLIVSLSAVYWKLHSTEPPEKQLRIWKQGFAVNDTFYDWKTCSGFWLLKTKEYTELHIEKTNGGEVKIQTGPFNAFQIQEVLSPFLTEEMDRRENIFDTIIRICKL